MKITKSMVWLVMILLGMAVCIAGISQNHLLLGTSVAYGANDADEDKGKEEKQDGAEKKEEPCPECPECPDPAKVVLEGLEKKKQAIEEERQAMEREKKELEQYAAQVDEKLESLATLRKQIQEDMALLDQKKSRKEMEADRKFEAKLAKLVKMYTGMKPKNAAAIINKMDLAVAQDIFLRMRGESASKILGFVDAEKAAKISEFLAYKK